MTDAAFGRFLGRRLVRIVTEETGSSRAPATGGPSVRLVEITDANRAAVEAVRILPEQEEYGDTVVEALEEAARSPDNRPWWRAVYVGDTPVGFVMLSLDAPPADERSPFRFFLWKLLSMRGSSGEGTAPRQSMRWSICFVTIRARMRCSPAPFPAPNPRRASTSTTASSAPGRSSTTRSCCDSTCTPGRRRPSSRDAQRLRGLQARPSLDGGEWSMERAHEAGSLDGEPIARLTVMSSSS